MPRRQKRMIACLSVLLAVFVGLTLSFGIKWQRATWELEKNEEVTPGYLLVSIDALAPLMRETDVENHQSISYRAIYSAMTKLGQMEGLSIRVSSWANGNENVAAHVSGDVNYFKEICQFVHDCLTFLDEKGKPDGTAKAILLEPDSNVWHISKELHTILSLIINEYYAVLEEIKPEQNALVFTEKFYSRIKALDKNQEYHVAKGNISRILVNTATN